MLEPEDHEKLGRVDRATGNQLTIGDTTDFGFNVPYNVNLS